MAYFCIISTGCPHESILARERCHRQSPRWAWHRNSSAVIFILIQNVLLQNLRFGTVFYWYSTIKHNFQSQPTSRCAAIAGKSPRTSGASAWHFQEQQQYRWCYSRRGCRRNAAQSVSGSHWRRTRRYSHGSLIIVSTKTAHTFARTTPQLFVCIIENSFLWIIFMIEVWHHVFL